MPGIEDKLMTASQIKEVTDTKLDKDFSSLDTSGGFSLTDELAVNISGSPYRITGRTLANAIGGGGTEQAALTNYVKNCGTISSLPATFTDSNITADMIVIEYTVGDESAVGSDWTVTTSDGSFTIAGTLAKSTSLSIVFGVGYSTTPSILTNLASDSPDNILKASPRPGVTGVLPLVNGGVGSSTAAGARTNLDVYSKSETDNAIQQSTASILPLSVLNGGTGATTAAGARTALGLTFASVKMNFKASANGAYCDYDFGKSVYVLSASVLTNRTTKIIAYSRVSGFTTWSFLLDTTSAYDNVDVDLFYITR